MGELIQLFPKFKKENAGDGDSHEKSERVEIDVDADKAMELIKTLTILRKTSPQAFREVTIVQRRSLIEGYSDEALAGWINNCTRSDVSAKPCFYTAIYHEAEKRDFFNKYVKE